MKSRLNNLPCGFLSLNSAYEIVFVNETFLQWTNFQQEEILGQHIEKLLPMSNKLIFHSYFYPSMSMYHHVEELFLQLRNAAGESMPYLINANEMNVNEEKFTDLVLVKMTKRIDYEREVRQTKIQLEKAYEEKNNAYTILQQLHHEIEQKQMELLAVNSELLDISNTDKLTGIANRRYFQQKLKLDIQQFEQDKTPLSLLIIDIDYFKRINDTYGHLMGDVVLTKLATILKDTSRMSDTVARFGGEEFTIILSNTDSLEALEWAKLFNHIVEKSKWSEIGRLTISVGCATYQVGDTEDSLLQHADDALYKSKRNGRNQATQYETLEEV